MAPVDKRYHKPHTYSSSTNATVTTSNNTLPSITSTISSKRILFFGDSLLEVAAGYNNLPIKLLDRLRSYDYPGYTAVDITYVAAL